MYNMHGADAPCIINERNEIYEKNNLGIGNCVRADGAECMWGRVRG